MSRWTTAGCGLAAALFLAASAQLASAQLMIVGNDEKLTFDENDKANPAAARQGHACRLSTSRMRPRRRSSRPSPLDNSIVGPPVNLAIHPSGEIALVANSVNVEQDGGAAEERAGQQGVT